jgi:hypothetical protein
MSTHTAVGAQEGGTDWGSRDPLGATTPQVPGRKNNFLEQSTVSNNRPPIIIWLLSTYFDCEFLLSWNNFFPAS